MASWHPGGGDRQRDQHRVTGLGQEQPGHPVDVADDPAPFGQRRLAVRPELFLLGHQRHRLDLAW